MMDPPLPPSPPSPPPPPLIPPLSSPISPSLSLLPLPLSLLLLPSHFPPPSFLRHAGEERRKEYRKGWGMPRVLERDLIYVKKEPMYVKSDLMYVKKDLIYVKRDPMYVKSDLIYVKRDPIYVKSDIFCIRNLGAAALANARHTRSTVQESQRLACPDIVA